MQEQAISLDEVDQNGNTAVHVAAQYGHLTCIQVCTAGKKSNSSVFCQPVVAGTEVSFIRSFDVPFHLGSTIRHADSELGLMGAID